MPKHRSTPEAIQLLLEGQLAFSEMSCAGVRVDKLYLDTTIEKMKVQIEKLEVELKEDKVYREWKASYGERTNFGSRDQLADILFNRMGFAAKTVTSSGRYSTQKADLEQIDHPFVKNYLKVEPLKNSLRVNMLGLRREIVERDGDWFVHPHFNLNTVVTFRSSSSKPNWQNYPKRNPEVASLVRPCFIPRRGWHFVEIDYAQIEVRVPACLTGDQELIRYIYDKRSDMHRDQAMACFLLREDEVSKPVRQTTKTNFVFAGFYGSPYFNCAQKLWDDINRYDLKTEQSILIKEHLAKKGITELGDCSKDAPLTSGTFVYVIEKAQRELWERFKVYKEWKRKQIDAFHRDGGMTMVTGFAINGPRSSTEIPNYGIQGPAFHCELWSIIEKLKYIKKHKMRTLLLGEIHDSDQANSPPNEIDDYLDASQWIMTEKIKKHWDWITVPLEVESEVAPEDKSWFACKEWVKSNNGLWEPKKK